MRKLFTLAVAAMTAISTWASEAFTFALSADGTKGYCYAQAGPTGGTCLKNNAFYYVSLNGPKKDGEMLNPYKTGIVFAPTVDVTMAVTLKTGSSNRTFNLKIEEIQNDYVWNAFVNCAGQEKAMPEKIFELADDTEKAWWKESSGGKVIKGEGTETKPYQAGTDDGSKKYMSGETPAEAIAKSVGTSDNIAVNGNATLENADIQVSGANYTFSKDKKYRLYLQPSSSSGLGIVSITFTASCAAPANPLVLKASKTADVVAGEEITFSTEGGNEADVTIAGKNGEEITANKWTAVKGEHTFTASQDVKDGVCGNTVELKITVAGTDPVTSATITGPSSAKVGKEVTLTCEAAEATSFQWYKDGAKIDDAKSAEYKFTPDAAGDIVFACEAWNKNNDETHPAVKSADFKVSVIDGECGLLATIKATAKDKATIEGEYAGTAVAKLSSTKSEYEGQTGYKMSNADNYLGADFTEGTLKAGDKVSVFVTTVSDGKKLQIYAEKDHSTLLVDAENIVQGKNTFVLGENAEGKKGLYVYRVLSGTDGAQYNAHVAYIELRRKCPGVSDDASLKSLTVKGDTVKAESDVYLFAAPADFADADIEVIFELNDANAKAKLDAGTITEVSAGKFSFKVIVPADASDTISKKLIITAEDEETVKEYTISITREEVKSNDATIKELKVNNVVVAEKEGVFAYEVPAAENLAKVKVEFVLNNANAKADKTSPFEVEVPAAGAAAKEETINVEAQDGTKKAYKVSVTKAKADQAVENVTDGLKAVKTFENGQLVIIKNGIKYNAQGAVIE